MRGGTESEASKARRAARRRLERAASKAELRRRLAEKAAAEGWIWQELLDEHDRRNER